MTDVFLAPGQGWVTAVPAWRATSAERTRALGAFEATRLLAELVRDRDRRGLVLLYRAATGFESSAPNLLREATLVAVVEAALTRGELLLLRTDVAGRPVAQPRHLQPASGAGARPDVPLATPSQRAPRIAQQDWIELRLEWDDGTPFDEDFLLTLPGGRTIHGPPDQGGVVRLDGLESGDCKLRFPDLFPAKGLSA